MQRKRLKTLGLNIKFARIRQGFSQEAFAEMVNVSRDTISNIETGKNETFALTLIDIARVLKVSIDDLSKDV